MSKWSFHSIDNWEDVWCSENVRHWEDVMQQSPNAHVFFHPRLVKAWVDTYLSLRHLEPIFIWAEDNFSNRGLLPLVLWKRNWKNAFMKSVVPIGYSDFDYHDPIFLHHIDDPFSFWKQVTEFIHQQYNFDELSIDGITDRMIGESSEWKRNDLCPSLSLDGLYDESSLLNFLKTSLRGDIRRQIRRMNEQGELRFHIYQTADEAWTTFDEFMQEHRHRWPSAYKAPGFHRNLIKQGMSEGLVHFSSLDVSNRPVAWHLGFVYRQHFYYYMPAGRQDFAQYSPAKVHLYYLVRWAIENHYAVFDHLRGDENYKAGWSNGQQYVHSMTDKGNRLFSPAKQMIIKTGRKLMVSHNQ